MRISGALWTEVRKRRAQSASCVRGEDRTDFLAILPSYATRTSHPPRFHLCAPKIRKNSRLFCRLKEYPIWVFFKVKLHGFYRKTGCSSSLIQKVSFQTLIRIGNKQERKIISHLVRSLWSGARKLWEVKRERLMHTTATRV